MHSYKITLTACAALLASTSLSRAAVVTTSSTHSAATNWGTSTSTTGFAPTFTIAMSAFNTGLGTLTGVNIIVVETTSGSVTLTNNGLTATNVNAFLTNFGKVLLPNTATGALNSLSKSLTAVTNTYTNASLAGGATDGPHAVSGQSTKSQAYSGAALTAFTSSWSILAGTLGTVTVGSGNGNGTASYSDTGIVDIFAQYTYTPTQVVCEVNCPEPASMALLGTGLVGAGLVRRRRKQG